MNNNLIFKVGRATLSTSTTRGLFLFVVVLSLLASAVGSPAQVRRNEQIPIARPAPCCAITSINASAGVVTAKVNATGNIFQFKIIDAAQLNSLKVGQAVYANFTSNQVSLDGNTPCCAIITPPAPPPPAPAPGTAPPPPPPSKPSSGSGQGGKPGQQKPKVQQSPSNRNSDNPTPNSSQNNPPEPTTESAIRGATAAPPVDAGQIQKQALPGVPCCTITAINTSTGVVTAKENATGKIFQFKVNDSALLNSLKVGQGVYANFGAMQVSLDGSTACCSIISIGMSPAPPPSPAAAAPAPNPAPAPQRVSPPSVATPAAKPEPAPTANASSAPSGSTAGSQQPAGTSAQGASQGIQQGVYTVSPGVYTQQRPQFKIIARGQGWNLHSVTGTFAGRTFTDEQSFLLIGREGILNAPIPGKVRDALLKDEQNSEGNDKVYIVHKRSAELAALGKVAELRQLSRVPVLVNPSGSTSSSTPPPPSSSVSLPGCDDPFGWGNTASASASTSFATPGDLLMLSLNNTNLGPVNATGEVDIKFPMKGQLEATVRLRILESFCAPVAFKLRDFRIKANMEVDSSLHLDAQIGADYDLNKRFHYDLYGFGFYIGTIPQWIALAAFVQPGTQFTAPDLIQVKYDATGKGQGGIDYTCTMNSCTGQRTFSHAWTNSGGISFGAQGLRAVVKPYVLGGLEVYLDDDVNGIVVYAGVEPYVQGDLWAYTGNCSATGVEAKIVGATGGAVDGARGVRSEYKALTADLDVGLESHMGFSAPMISSLLAKDFTHDVWTKHIQFYDLIGSTAIDPAVTADMPAYAGRPKNIQVQMRPCWPYTDKMAYHVVWGDGTADAFAWGTANNSTTQSHSWATAGQYNLVATLYADEHGRVFPDRGTTVPVEVKPVLGATVPVEIHAGAPPAVADTINPQKPVLVRPPVQPLPCCKVTAIDSRASIGTAKTGAIGRTSEFQVTNPGPLADPRTGLVLAHVNATGQPFVFFIKDPATRQSLKVGQGVYANFPRQQVSLDGGTECCAILALGKANPGTQGMAPKTATPAEAAKPSAGFILSARAPIGSAGNPAVIVPTDWARRVSIPAGSTTPGARYTIISAAQYQAFANGPAPVSPVETLLQEGRGGSIDGYYLVDAASSRVHQRPPRGGTVGGVGGSGTGSTAGSNDPSTFLANANPGDILFASHPVVNYDTFGEFNHAAMVITANWGQGNVPSGEALLAEETAYDLGTDQPGARLVFWSDFIDPSRNYNKIALGRVVGMNEQQMNNVVAWAISRLGRPYRWPTDAGAMDDDNRMYCSQYVWIDYKRNMSIDLDSDGGLFVIFVTPDDIYDDQHVKHIGEVDLPTSGLPF